MKKSRTYTLAIFIGIITIVIGVNWSMNSKIRVDEVTMEHKNLPEEFNGYKILQVSDLHESVFGDNQQKLIDAINSLNYDLLLFTGDYLDDKNQDIVPLEALLKGISFEGEKYYVLGNSDEDNSTATLKEGNRFYDLFSKYGFKSLHPGVEIVKGNDSIWLKTSPYEAMSQINMDKTEEQLALESNFAEEYASRTNPFTIEVSHIPTPIDQETEDMNWYRENNLNDTETEWRKFNMSISGHTHGGQVRLPLIGAVTSPNSGLFPDEVNINGVHYVDDKVQYVCPGLGASGPSFLQFRFFNPPTLGLIELQTKTK